MLTPAYQHPRKNSSTKDFLALKQYFEQQNLQIELEISSDSVWSCVLNLSEDMFSGVLDLQIRPRILDLKGHLEAESRFASRFRVEQCHMSMGSLKDQLMRMIAADVLDLKTGQC